MQKVSLVIDGWQIDVGARTARRGERTIVLSPRAIRLLQAMIDAGGATVSRAELMQRVWPNVIVSDESLTQVVSEVRRKLECRDLIATVARGGYRMTHPGPGQAIRLPYVGSANEPSLGDLEAHARCLEARREMVRCGPGAIQRADDLTCEAVELAPECAMTRSERAVALVRSHLYWSEGRDRLTPAISDAQYAVDADPRNAAGYSALGYALASAGHWDAAEIAHRRALASEERSAPHYHLAAWYLMSRRRTRSAVAYFEQVGDLEPDNIKGLLHAAQLASAFDLERSRRNSERALSRARNRLESDPEDMRALVACALLMALLGEHTSSHATLDTIDTTGSAQGVYIASTLAILGETDRALMALEELFDHGWRDRYWLEVDPAFSRISSDRRFRKMHQSLLAA